MLLAHPTVGANEGLAHSSLAERRNRNHLAGFRLLQAGCRCLQAGGRYLQAGCRCLQAGGRYLQAGGRCLQAGCRCLQAGGRYLQAGGRYLQAGGRLFWSGDRDYGVNGFIATTAPDYAARRFHLIEFASTNLCRLAFDFSCVSVFEVLGIHTKPARCLLSPRG